MKKRPVSPRHGCLAWMILCGFILSMLALGVTPIIFSPGLAAQGADILRNVIGDDAVSHLESIVFQMEDTVEGWRYDLGFITPSAPWSTSEPEAVQPPIAVTPILPTGTPLPASTETIPIPGPTAVTHPSPMPVWMPPPAIALGSLNGEGAWSIYIQDSSGQNIAYRTYLQPDPSRPYAVVGVIAFDTNRTRLHYVLGSTEPFSPDSPQRTGQMPAEDKVPGFLIATFNGGFKARHGRFGAMADGIVALPPRDDLGTIGIYGDGKLLLGEWGSDLHATPDMSAWRQNGPLVLHDGQINPRIYDDSPFDWGYTVDDVSPTWRSGIGLSSDSNTFYYLCGSNLSMEMLAKSMQAVGVFNGIQLDINNYWVHFVAVRDIANSLRLEPLFPDMMFENVDRYLSAYSRDYFYVTLAK